MLENYNDLSVIILDEDFHKQTCNYWYLVHNRCSSHVAFHTKGALLRWLGERGLELTEPLTEPGVHSFQQVKGEYNRESHLDEKEFYALPVVALVGELSNGDFTLGIVTVDDKGIKTVHCLNPNVRSRPVFDYRACNKLYR